MSLTQMSTLYAAKKAQKTAECAKAEAEEQLHVKDAALEAESSSCQELEQALNNVWLELEAKTSQLDVECNAHWELRQRLDNVEWQLWNDEAELQLRANIGQLNEDIMAMTY
ncbi:uncharacterized protein LAESUDRAFT_754358 [Laetiporus sulphureus 93-53]|uniref:Uncharacterized protein n=1 Tax=Laetiporus sulphureus 93-53 TaxID=1314785 RepID=A0A165HJF9_9APHY|nr:uncharacterized protein LAESUDRAFT_754358 [Laetiporus sulphureus 93-53]KZT11805.1 hypothetical protein LAESUDRAFT_754358 [Laetiporus sulphureus 93-53]